MSNACSPLILLALLFATACTATPPPAPPPAPVAAADGADPCLDELLKSADEPPAGEKPAAAAPSGDATRPSYDGSSDRDPRQQEE